jgi:hypothetical protein
VLHPNHQLLKVVQRERLAVLGRLVAAATLTMSHSGNRWFRAHLRRNGDPYESNCAKSSTPHSTAQGRMVVKPVAALRQLVESSGPGS